MPRARNLKVSFFKNETLAECHPLARILFEGLWCEADRDGRMEDRPKRLKVEYLPYDDVDVDQLLWQLAERNFIKRYTANGCNYIWIPNFGKHQHPHRKEESKCYPEFTGTSREITGQALESSLPARLNVECGMLNVECGNLNADDLPTEDSAETGDAGQSAANDPPVETFPVDGSQKPWKLPRSRYERYVELYPNLDVLREIALAKQWLIDNPTKKKTPGGMLKFLTGWMNRSQNSSRAGPPLLAERPSIDPSALNFTGDE